MTDLLYWGTSILVLSAVKARQVGFSTAGVAAMRKSILGLKCTRIAVFRSPSGILKEHPGVD